MLAWRGDPACPGWAKAYAAHRAERAKQATERAVERAESDRARQAAIAALSGPGRALAHQVVGSVARDTAQRRTEQQRKKRQVIVRLVAHRRT